MTKQSYTPGPWQYLKMRLGPNATDRRSGFVVNGPDKEPLPTRICDLRVPNGLNGYPEGEANARLIAAAPEMAEALADCAAWAKSRDGTPEADDKALVSIADITRAILAKIEGAES